MNALIDSPQAFLISRNSPAREWVIMVVAVCSLMSACVQETASPQDDGLVESVQEVAIFPLPPGSTARDVGFSVQFEERSVWIFGDTFFREPASDGFQWRSSSWSSIPLGHPLTDHLVEVEHGLGADGKPEQLLRNSDEEFRFNLSHLGEQCEARQDCGARRTPWPMVPIVSADGLGALIFYSNMETGSGDFSGPDEWNFRSISGSVAVWDDLARQPRRVEPPLFSDEEPDWGTAGVRVGSDVYLYAFETIPEIVGGQCRLARVRYDEATNRSSYRFFADNGQWSGNWQDAVPVMSCGPLFSVLYIDYLSSFVAFYMQPLADRMMMRMAAAPEGPWSRAYQIGNTEPASGGAWNYALIAHPEFAEEGGRVQYLSYTRPTGFLSQEIRIVKIAFH